MNKYLRAISSNVIYFILGTVFFILILPVAIKVLGETFFEPWSVLYARMLDEKKGVIYLDALFRKPVKLQEVCLGAR